MSKESSSGTSQAFWSSLFSGQNEQAADAIRNFCSYRIDPEDAARLANISIQDLWTVYLEIRQESESNIDELVEKIRWYLCRHGSDDERVAQEIGTSVENLRSILEQFPQFRLDRMLGDIHRNRDPRPARRALNFRDKKQYVFP